MDKRISQRKSGQVIAAAIASVGLAGLGASQADAGLVIDVRALSATAGNTITNGGKTVNYTSGTVTVTMGVFARLSGTNATQQIGDFGGGGDDTRNDDQLAILVGSFNSVGGLLGNLGGTATAGNPPSYGPRITPFNNNGSTNGLVQDWDSDGDLDLGAGPPTTDPTNMFVGRAGTPSSATTFNGSTAATKGWSNGPDGGATSGLNANDTVIDATTQELQVGVLRFITTGAGGTAAVVNYIPRPGTDGGVALWFEDGVATAKTPGTSPFAVNPGVLVQSIPEPTTLGLLGIASLGLLARRRKD